jgi:SAM-dependent methyltransferase
MNNLPMKFLYDLLEHPFVFNLSQLPFNRQKFARILAHNDLKQVRAVLDVGCGPGTNAPRFAHAQYLGIDINDRYIRLARRRYRRDFLVADVTTSEAIPAGSYDFILVNSFLHHIDTPDAHRVLSRASKFLTADGHLHSIEPVLPENAGMPRWLALHDRGKFPRSLSAWREIFTDKLETVIFEPFPVRHLGRSIVEQVYFKGRIKQ